MDCVLFRVGKDRQRNPHCIRSSRTECDLTNELRNLQETYSADILSEPLPGVTSDLVEFPYTRAERFSPYKHSECHHIINLPYIALSYSNISSRSFIIYIVIVLYNNGIIALL